MSASSECPMCGAAWQIQEQPADIPQAKPKCATCGYGEKPANQRGTIIALVLIVVLLAVIGYRAVTV